MKSLASMVLSGVTAVSMAQVKSVGGAYTLEANYRKGQVLRFVSTNSSPMMAKPMKMNMTWTVVNVVNGKATIKIQIDGLGSNTPKPTMIEIDRHNAAAGANAYGAAYPVGKIKVGAKWKAKLPMPSTVAQGVPEATYTFKGIKTVGGKKVAEIGVAMTGMGVGKGTQLVSCEDGILYSNDMTISLTMGQNTVTVTSHLVRK